MRLAAIVTLVLALLLAGCASTLHWRKAGATPAEFARDSYECARQSQQSVFRFGGPWWLGVSDSERINKSLYRACLQTYGYERVEGGEFVGLRD